MIVKHYSRSGTVTDITQLVGTIQSSGDLLEVSRSVEISVTRPNRVYGISAPNVLLGEAISLEIEGKEIFYGFVWDIEMDDNEIEQKILCFDHLIYVMRSESSTQVFTKKSAEYIIKQVCKEVGVSVGKLPSVATVSTINGRNETAYNILMMCCTEMRKVTGKSYYPIMRNRKLQIIEKGELTEPVIEYRTESIDGTLLSLQYKAALDNLVNKIIVKDDKGKKVDVISNSEDIKKYGQIMKQYYKQKGESKTVAKNLLQSAEHTIQISCIGAWSLRTGYSVTVKTGLFNAKFYIRSDTHHWSNGIHTTDLTLEFENNMDKKELPKQG